MIEKLNYFDSYIDLRLTEELLNYFKYISHCKQTVLFRRLIREYLNGERTPVKQTYINKFAKMFPPKKANRITNGTYYNFAKKDSTLKIPIKGEIKETLKSICKSRNMSLTALVEEIYFSFLREIAFRFLEMSPKEREIQIKIGAIVKKKDEKNYDLVLKDGQFYEQYKFKIK